MKENLLSILECTYCGAPFQTEQLQWADGDIRSGILICPCSAYPIVEGIAVLRTGVLTKEVLKQVNKGALEEARRLLLPSAASVVREAIDSEQSFEESIARFSPGAESDYFLHRFSDPTFIVAEGVARLVARFSCSSADAWILDLAGGTGHLASSIQCAARNARIVIADSEFWKLWLARRFVAPSVEAICCNANEPLPFRDKIFSFSNCADAISYIWSKRLCVSELQRVTTDRGVTAILHAHNRLVANESEGMPLSPAEYAALFRRCPARLFGENALFHKFLAHGKIDLTRDRSSTDADEAVTFVAASEAQLFEQAALDLSIDDERPIWINPLYRPATSDGEMLKLTMPSDFYAREYGERLKQFLPQTVRRSDLIRNRSEFLHRKILLQPAEAYFARSRMPLC
jgi:ubiquinone/menaquinone biosynthesis C-methylase UbiE